MKNVKIKPKSKNEAGFAMLFSVLTASLLVSIGVSIFGISLKELMIATSVRDSQTAYYAADSAQECVVYWDQKFAPFPSCFDSTCSSKSTTTPNAIRCNDNEITFYFIDPTDGNLTYASTTKNFFQYSLSDITAAAADMIITKRFIPAGSPGNPGTDHIIQTTIVAQGHNTGVLGRRVERGISQAYNSQ